MSRIYFLTPTFRPVGGVIKIFDYALHALALGHEPVICCPEPFDDALPIFSIARFAPLRPDRGVRHIPGFTFGVEPSDFVFFSWPTHFEQIAPRLAPGTSPERVIHIVQNTRHANPQWLGGYAARLLTRPMARIMVTQETLAACMPYLNPRSLTRVITEGHDWHYFHKRREGEVGQPLRVAYTTWKSQLGVRLEDSLAGDGRFAFRSIRGTASWAELRELYQWADVVLGTPGPEEGFYLVGLEAMAAGALLVTADAGGNRAYSRFGENCLEAGLESDDGYRRALERVLAMSPAEVAAMRSAAYAVLENHTLRREQVDFGQFLRHLERRASSHALRPDAADEGGPGVAVGEEAAGRPARLRLTPEQAGRVPTFIGIGAQKAGTTWLHRNLRRHPRVCFPPVKEAHFLDSDENFRRGLDWYLRLFGQCTEGIRGEITPDYMIVHRSRVEWLHALNPDLRLILLIRNPVDRAWSAMRYFLANRGVDPAAEPLDSLRELACSPMVTERGAYSRTIRLWESVFSPEQLFVGFFEDIVSHPEALLRRVLRHIGTDADVDFGQFPLRTAFNRGQEAALPPELAAFLKEMYAGETAAIAKRYGSPATDW